MRMNVTDNLNPAKSSFTFNTCSWLQEEKLIRGHFQMYSIWPTNTMHAKVTHKIQVQRKSNITGKEREVTEAVCNPCNNKRNPALGSQCLFINIKAIWCKTLMWTEIILPLQPLPKTLMSKLWIGKLYAGLSIFCLPTDSKKKKKA